MISMNNIVKRFGTQTVLSDVTFEVKEKEIFGLLGPSGAGKTTIINIHIRRNGTHHFGFGCDCGGYGTKKSAFLGHSGS